jgi:hypothetical protein
VGVMISRGWQKALPRSGYLSIDENIMRGPGRVAATSPLSGNVSARGRYERLEHV